MALLRRVPSKAAITAAASRVFQPDLPQSRSLAPDAPVLYGLYDRLGQIRAALQFKSMAASKIDYYVARKADPGESPEKVEEGPAVEAFQRLQGTLGEFADFVSEFCLHLDIAGEGYLIGRGTEDPSLDDDWDVWSPVEYDMLRLGQQRLNIPDAPKPLNPDDFVLRVWRPHPMRREFPDSALRSVQAECEQYILLRGVVTSLAQSRLIAGVFGVPEELSFPPKANGDPADPFFETLMDAMEAAVMTPDHAHRIAPIGVQGPADLLDKMRFMDLTRDLPEWVPVLMERVLRQIATGLDLPADILLGLADVNHWNAWLSEDSAKLDYVDPLVLLILDSLTRGYLHPTLEEMGVPDARDYLFWRDYSDLIARSVGTEDAVALYDRGIISADSVRRTVGFTEADKPEDSELESQVRELEEVFPAGPDTVDRDIPRTLTAAGRKFGLGQIDHRLYAQISEAAQAALDRTLERAGAKIRNQVRGKTTNSNGTPRPPKHPQLFSAIDGVPNAEVGWTLGRNIRDTLQLSDADLVPEDSFDALSKRVDKILASGQDETYQTISQMTGTTPERDKEEEAGWRELAIAAFVAGLVSVALRRLFTPDLTPDPAETGEVEPTAVPAPLIFDTLTLAGGGQPGFGPEAPRGLANGVQAEQWITQAGFQIREREWTVGSPAMPFEPHRNLRGTRFTEWSDPALTAPIDAGWLGVSYMFPGDHSGCQCLAELVVAEAEDLLTPIAV